MKQTTKWLGLAALIFASSAVTATVIRTQTPPAEIAETPKAVAAPVPAVTGGLVDLTAAAESSVNAVVYIKVTQNGKTQRVQVRDPFAEFFGEF